MAGRKRGGWIFVAVLAVVALGFGAPSPALRPLELGDIFELESVGRYFGNAWTFSPDGQSIAFTRVRAKKTLANHQISFLWGNEGGDVWVQLGAGQPPTNLTHGDADGSGWWSPQWSPDGRHLAMLSTRGGNVRLWAWEKATKQLRPLTERGVDLTNVTERPYVWVDARRILCPVLPVGERPALVIREQLTPELAGQGWAKATLGQEPTASVLESGVPIDPAARSRGQLQLLDAATGESRTLVDRGTSAWQAAPGGQAVAYARQASVYAPRADEPLPFGVREKFTVGAADLAGRMLFDGAVYSGDVLPDSLRWSSAGDEFVFLGYGDNRAKPPRLFRANLATGQASVIDLGELDAAPAVRLQAQVECTAAGDLLLLAAKGTATSQPEGAARRDWWLIGRDGTRRCLTAEMPQAPAELWPQAGRAAFIGLAGGKIWRITPAGGAAENLSGHFADKVEDISWPARTRIGLAEFPVAGRAYGQVIFSTRENRELLPHRLDLSTGQIRPLAKPAPAAELAAYAPASDTAIYHASDRTGTFVWRASPQGSEELMSANLFLRGVAEGEFKPIDYTGLDGQKLKGWIILPVGYEPGKRYPLITWVYAGTVARATPSLFDRISNASALSKQIPPARGYAVLIPSMPLRPEGGADDPMLKFPDGVLPAVEKAVELGIADPERVFLMGQSFGGYATYGLVTQTKRFRAAVALAGLANLVSLYGAFDARLRYAGHPHENLFQASLMEGAQVRMGQPPWKDLERYLRNSPIFSVDRVETPLMIVQGDLDYVSMQQGEEFFTSLYRQGKRAQFVRYWGEGHVLRSPANIRDMWARTFAWFEEFGDLQRDDRGAWIFEGDRVASRHGKPAWAPERFLRR